MSEPARHPLSIADLPALLAEAVAQALPERGLTIDKVCEITTLDRSTVYRRIAAGSFPRPRKDGDRTLWLESDVSKWLRGLPKAQAR